MFYEVFKAKDLIDLDGEKMVRKTLLENNNSGLMLIALKKDEILDPHISPEDAAVYVIDGEIEIHFEAQKFEIDKGEILMFRKEREHKVLAKKDSKFMVIRV